MGYKKIKPVSEKFWNEKINPVNKELVEDFLSQQQLSDQTLKQYKSALLIFCKWVYENKGEDVKITSLKARDGMRYQNRLIELGLSSSAIKFKRSAVSSLYGYIEVFWGDEYPDCRNIFTKAVPNVANNTVREVIPLTYEEVELIESTLRKNKDWQKLAFFLTAYETAGRRAEIIQLKTEVANYEIVKDKNGKTQGFYFSHPIRGKGRGKAGKPIKLMIGKKSMNAIRQWLKSRGEDDCEYIFVSKHDGKYEQISVNTTNNWVDSFGKIIGRKINPHLLRKSRATHIVVDEEVDIKFAQKLLNHEDSSTTDKHYVIRSDEDDDFSGLF